MQVKKFGRRTLPAGHFSTATSIFNKLKGSHNSTRGQHMWHNIPRFPCWSEDTVSEGQKQTAWSWRFKFKRHKRELTKVQHSNQDLSKSPTSVRFNSKLELLIFLKTQNMFRIPKIKNNLLLYHKMHVHAHRNQQSSKNILNQKRKKHYSHGI